MTFRPLPILTAFAAAALVILLGLGTWQLQRRAEKHALLAQIAARQDAPAAPIEILIATGDYAAFRKAVALGAFDHAKEAYVYAPRADGGLTRLGKKVLTPFHLTSGDTILVDRGWVSLEWSSADHDKSVPEPEGEVEIEGVLRPSAVPGAFTPPAEPDKRLFYARDTAAMAKSMGITLKTGLVLELTRRLGNPEPLSATIDIPDNHLNYAITWFALAIVLLVIYLRYHFVRGRLKIGR